MIELEGGTFAMGSPRGFGNPGDGEGTRHDVVLSPFAIAATTVTVADFERFVDATGHRTTPEVEGWSFVFAGHLDEHHAPTQAVVGSEWWRAVPGADWRHPKGASSNVRDLLDHPVVHVSWDDAIAYCVWADASLSSEAQWEFAARGGLAEQVFPWGDEREPDGEYRMNTFQGEFPTSDSGADGWVGTCPANAFAPNGYGLYNTTGNVWEWCNDWFSPTEYERRTAAAPTEDPIGPRTGAARVMRGGSYLCHDSYCSRYRVAARSFNTPDASADNIGFRISRPPSTPGVT